MLIHQHTDWRAGGTQFSHLGGGGGLLGWGLETRGYWDDTIRSMQKATFMHKICICNICIMYVLCSSNMYYLMCVLCMQYYALLLYEMSLLKECTLLKAYHWKSHC